MPAYNEKEGIAAAVRSLASGDHPGIEVIVVDDGSTDGTADIVDALALPNVEVIRKPNGGKASALNFGVGRAKGGMDQVTVAPATALDQRGAQGFQHPAFRVVAAETAIEDDDQGRR